MTSQNAEGAPRVIKNGEVEGAAATFPESVSPETTETTGLFGTGEAPKRGVDASHLARISDGVMTNMLREIRIG